MKVISLLIFAFFSNTLLATSVSRIKKDIESFKFNPKNNLAKTLGAYHKIQKDYLNFTRKREEGEKIVELKYQMQIFNKWFSQRLYAELSKKRYSSQKIQKIINQLPFMYTFKEAARLGVKYSGSFPQKHLNVETLLGTYWSEFKTWKDLEASKGVIIDDETALYHGIYLKTGDVIVGDINSYGYEYMAATRDSEQTGNHSAIFVMMKDGNRFIPTVFDMHANGLRASPLSHYLDRKINTYLEVYRLKRSYSQGLSSTWQHSVREYFNHQLNSQYEFKFDFTADPKNNERKKLTCTELVQTALGHGGVDGIEVKTKTRSDAYAPFSQLGYFSQEYLSPNDYMYDEKYELIGYLDMLNVRRNLLIKLNSVALEYLFQHYQANIPAMKKIISDNVKGINHMKNKGSFLGQLLREVSGLKHSSFPAGHPNLIAISKYFEDQIEVSVLKCLYPQKKYAPSRAGQNGMSRFRKVKDKCYRHFKPLLDSLSPQFNVHHFLNDEKNIKVMLGSMKPILSLFYTKREL